MTSETYVVGIDLGGTKILSVCVDSQMNIVGQDYRETNADEGPAAVIARMAESARAAAGGRDLIAAGVSAPGPLDIDRGIVTTAPNLPGWNDVPLAALISEHLGLRAWIENDANAAAVAEHRLGAGKGARHVILIAVGTGIGGGLILDGRLYHGATGGAGEVGHMLIDPAGPVCGCGRTGCLEAVASGLALNAAAERIAAERPEGLVAQLSRREQEEPDARILDLAATEADPAAIEALRRAGTYFGAGLTNLVNVFNPEVVVVGGSVRKSEIYLQTAVEVMRREAYAQHSHDVRVVEAALGDEAPAIGAALIALDHLDA